ncbi:MAG: L-2-hydroxyglutarate oxidase [Salinisphaera sp.]|nr:L-2-hydroxyglutarate oxidase [Salinisphaera sp.]
MIIGGGIIGLAVARELTRRRPQSRLLLVEKEERLSAHQTGHNSGVIHAGVYYAPDSLKATFCKAGNRATREFCDGHGIPYVDCGKLVVAITEAERDRLGQLWQRIKANGLERRWLDSRELAEYEPSIRGTTAIFVPASGIVDYRAVAQALADDVIAAGGEIRCATQVTAIHEYPDEIVVETSNRAFHTRRLTVCAGLMADRVARLQGLNPDFMICPFRGEYYRLKTERNGCIRRMIYPVPDPALPFLGVHLTPMVNGSITVGPNAVLAFAREGYRKTDVSLADSAELLGFPGIRKMLAANMRFGLHEFGNSIFKRRYLHQVQLYCPSLTLDDLQPHPAGVRAQAVGRDGALISDFLFLTTRRSLHVCNAPSPAATSALPIAAYISNRLDDLS